MSQPYVGDSNNPNTPGIIGNNAAVSGTVNAIRVEGISTIGEAVHGESSSAMFASVAGIALTLSGTGAGVYGESRGKGAGVWCLSQVFEGVHPIQRGPLQWVATQTTQETPSLASGDGTRAAVWEHLGTVRTGRGYMARRTPPPLGE
jgi:hypothetical protein